MRMKDLSEDFHSAAFYETRCFALFFLFNFLVPVHLRHFFLNSDIVSCNKIQLMQCIPEEVSKFVQDIRCPIEIIVLASIFIYTSLKETILEIYISWLALENLDLSGSWKAV